jgi:hypothetical protein
MADVNVHTDHRGGWEVSAGDCDTPVHCETLPEAQRVARQLASPGAADLVVHDAYERVIDRALLDPRWRPTRR